jgi:hypothetical protein
MFPVDIEKFWGWSHPQTRRPLLWFEIRLKLCGPVGPFVDGEIFDSSVRKHFPVIGGGGIWKVTIKTSLDELNRDIAEDLAAYRKTIEARNIYLRGR